MKALLTLALLLTYFCDQSHASIGADKYYPGHLKIEFQNPNPTMNSDTLKDTLFAVVRRYHVTDKDGYTIEIASKCPPGTGGKCYIQRTLGYKKAKKALFQVIDIKQDKSGYYIRDVYCHKKIRKNISPKKMPNDRVLNCEHSWPKSNFTSFTRSKQESDLHHLFPSDAKANSTRGNLPFGEVRSSGGIFGGCGASQKGRLDDPEVPGSFFQPPAEHRGDLARALFYFAIRYRGDIDDVQEFYLRKWHEEDPVTQEEIDRNTRIQKLQRNRNPFIDFPELVNNINDF